MEISIIAPMEVLPMYNEEENVKKTFYQIFKSIWKQILKSGNRFLQTTEVLIIHLN